MIDMFDYLGLDLLDNIKNYRSEHWEIVLTQTSLNYLLC